MGIIETIRDQSGPVNGVDHHVQNFWPPNRPRFDPRPAKKGDPVAEAKVNHGRWLVSCPYCPSAQLADPDYLFFFCVDCLMEQGEGRMVAVKWPSPVLIPAIEAALEARPVRTTRNWETWEEVSNLLAENVMHGTGDFSRKAELQLDEHGSVGLPGGLAYAGSVPLGFPGFGGSVAFAPSPEEK